MTQTGSGRADLPEIDAVAEWARSGAMALTGPAAGPALGPPAPLVPRLRDVASRIAARSSAIGREVSLDPIALLAQRAAIAGLRRRGDVSCGGGTRLLRCVDGWIAVSLARGDDIDLVPAWLEVEIGDDADPWHVVGDALRDRRRDDAVDRAALLGLPVSGLPDDVPTAAPSTSTAELPCFATRHGDAVACGSIGFVRVVDLSALWAGPLCGSLLAMAGADVVKVESTRRPDGARHGPAAFYDLLNASKRSVALDFTAPAGIATLQRLVACADVVIESSRPRALAQLGIDAGALVESDAARPRVWLSITAHGRTGAAADRAGFGDDTAVAGGLVAWDGDIPLFCADAIADPCTGLVAAAAVLDALAAPGRWLLDVPLARVAAHLAGPTLLTAGNVEVASPRVPPPAPPAPALGAHTAEVLDEWSAP
jgi:crotonobetainyl-CoA:carnitine CoA-transferase CaiB-like acyl-CoA transferase